MTPEAKAREQIDKKLQESGWVIQDIKTLNLTVALGVAVCEFQTSTGPVDYALFVDGVPVGVAEAKKDEKGAVLTGVEGAVRAVRKQPLQMGQAGIPDSVCL